MNAIAAEISLLLDHMTCGLVVGEHLPGKHNFLADALSRLSEGAKLPSCLNVAERRLAPVRNAAFFAAWPSSWSENKTCDVLHIAHALLFHVMG